MIFHTSRTELPRWMHEFNRNLPLKSLFLLHGNIYDLLSYPVNSGSKHKWGYFPLRQFLHLFFREREYQAVAFYDAVDGVNFFTPHEQDLFENAYNGKVQPDRYSASNTEIFGSHEKQKSTTPIRPRGEAPSPRSPETANSVFSRLRDFDAALSMIRHVLEQSKAPVAVVIDHSSQLITSPEHLSPDERRQFIHLLKCMQKASVRGGGRNMNHVLVLVCDRLSDLPSWLYLNNPLVKPLQIELPNELERRRYFEMAGEAFFVDQDYVREQKREVTVDLETAVELTRGLRNYELECIRLVSLQEKIPLKKTKNLVESYKFGVKESPWERLRKDEGRNKLIQAKENLGKRVKGQNAAMVAVVDIIKRAASGLSGIHHSASAHKPKGVLFFAGPTGVGKTEMARALAELLFRDENACIRFDMSEYAQEHSDQKLLGAPPGYVGYQEGGQLTNKVKEVPFSVLLFDEIEKAHPKIMDKFLQILEDGRMTDSKGETVYFSESVIIFTSNIGAYIDVSVEGSNSFMRKPNILPYYWHCTSCGRVYFEADQPSKCQCGHNKLDYLETPYRTVKKKFLKAVEEHFKQKLGRPEIYNRIGNNFVVFDYIRRPVTKQILDKIIDNILEELMEKRGIKLEFAQVVHDFLLEKALNNIQDGGRGIGNLVETVLINPLSRVIFDHQVEHVRMKVKKITEKHDKEEVIYELETSFEQEH